MIDITIGATGRLSLSQWQLAPAVYLDHWALRDFADAPGLAVRFRSALEARNGTLMLSWANVAEFTKVSTEAQARATEDFIEGILPRVYFIEVNPFVVLQRERLRIDPQADFAMFATFVGLRPDTPRPFTARGLFSVVKGHALDSLSRWNATYVEKMKELKQQYAGKEDFRESVQRSLKEHGADTATLVIVRELIATALREGRRIEDNDTQDFFHTVVPIVYCEWVLLERRWETAVDAVRSQLAKAAVSIPLARVASGSKKSSGIEGLLAGLESAAS